MPAFNSRLKPKKIGHMPLYAVMGLLGMLITGVLSLVLPYPAKLVVMGLFIGCLFVTGICFWIGDEIAFVPVKLASRREKNRVTSETWTDG